MASDLPPKQTFSNQYLSEFLISRLYPGTSKSRLQAILAKATTIPDLLNSRDRYHMTRSESFTISLKNGVAIKSFSDSQNLSKSEKRFLSTLFTGVTPHRSHNEFLLPSLELQASQEQKAKWLNKCENLEFLGSYSQTELGHGSNVRGIETEARYDHSTKEFIFHTPTAAAAKWWIGGLGLASTHTLLVARLIVNGSDFGPHAFFVQIRDLKTHEPLNGVEVGDIGPKMGLNGNDYGYLVFNSYRQPKEVMLNRFAKVNDDGEYEVIDTNGIKILYLSLIRMRSGLILDGWFPLAAALTVAIRYSLVRRQFSDPDDPKIERQILDYQAQKHKLFRLLARLYAFAFMRANIEKLYTIAEDKLKNGDDSDLPFLHCIVSLYKSYVTAGFVEGIEECRRSCGGHGFLMDIGIPSMYLDTVPAMTVDGDNSILSLQSARYFISVINKTKKAHESLSYLLNNTQVLEGEVHSADFHQKCFETVTRQRFQRLLHKEQKLLAQGVTKPVIWNKHLQIEAISASEAAFATSIHQFYIQTQLEITDPNTKVQIELLRQLFAVSELEKFPTDLLRAGLTPQHLTFFKEIQLSLLESLRPAALDLIHAFAIPDVTLNSVLTHSPNLYSSMLDSAKSLNPLNKSQVFPNVRTYLSPKL